jgi:hypothetical protein
MKVNIIIIGALLAIVLSGCIGAAALEGAEVAVIGEELSAGMAETAVEGEISAEGGGLVSGIGDGASIFTKAEETNLLSNETILSKESEYLGKTITSDLDLNKELQDIRMSRNPSEPPKLYINEKPFAEVIEDGSKIRILESGEIRTLPGRIFSVTADEVKFRSSAGTSTGNVIDNVHLKNGQLVIKLCELSNGCNV